MPDLCLCQHFAITSLHLFLLHLHSLSTLSLPRNQFSFPPFLSLLTSLWAVHPQTPSDRFLLAWSL